MCQHLSFQVCLYSDVIIIISMICVAQSHYLHFTPTNYIRLRAFAYYISWLYQLIIFLCPLSWMEGAQFHKIEITLTRIKGALYRIQILCRRYTFWSYPAGLTIADPPG